MWATFVSLVLFSSPLLAVNCIPGSNAIFCDGFEGDGAPSTGEFSGAKWNDLNGNGQRDTDESGLPGVTIYVDSNQNGALDQGEPSKVTDVDGAYVFTDLATGVIQVREVVPDGFNQTFPIAGYHELPLVSGLLVFGVDFGNKAQ